ncbi:anti-sigma factor [Streptomyces sp. NPDC092359]|uniref:anti-sigma factor n=1 Tax=Streptomyces sp. NPDC092359 TaxID=3366014 RepID=UPI003824BFBB
MKQHRSDVHAFAAAYALHALEPTEHHDFGIHLPHCEDCRRDLAEFEATAARLAAAVGRTPPDGLKQRTLAAVDGVRQLPPPVDVTRPTVGLARRLRGKAVPLALAAGVAAAVSFAGVAAWQHQRGEQARERAQRAEQRLDTAGSVLAAPDARTVRGRTAGGALTTVVSSDSRRGAVFTVTGLPAPAAGRTYQLWLARGGTMYPAGLVHGDGTVVLDGDPSGVTAVGLTVEPAGGSARPTTQPLLLLALPS